MNAIGKMSVAFNSLNEKGIIAGWFGGCCQSCAWAEIEEIDHINFIGAAFATEQDAANLLKEGLCFISYDAFDENEESAIKVAGLTIEALQNAGFEVIWSGDITERLKVIV